MLDATAVEAKWTQCMKSRCAGRVLLFILFVILFWHMLVNDVPAPIEIVTPAPASLSLQLLQAVHNSSQLGEWDYDWDK